MNYPELVDKFNTDGYLIIPDAIDSSTVDQLKRLIDQLQSKAIKEIKSIAEKQGNEEVLGVLNKTYFAGHPEEDIIPEGERDKI